MHSTVEHLSSTRVHISTKISFIELKSDFDRVYRILSKQIYLSGFRNHKIPNSIVKARFHKDLILEQVIKDVMLNFYCKMVLKYNIKPLGLPEVNIKELHDGQTFTFIAEVDICPELSIPEFNTFSITVKEFNVHEEFKKETQSLQAKFGTLTKANRQAKKGDLVSISILGNISKVSITHYEIENFSYELDSNLSFKEFDKVIIGMNCGDSKTFFKKISSTSKHKKQDAYITVVLQEVREFKLPSIDKSFAKLVNRFEKYKELQKNIKYQIYKKKSTRQFLEIRKKLVETLIKNIDLTSLESLIQNQIAKILVDNKNYNNFNKKLLKEEYSKQSIANKDVITYFSKNKSKIVNLLKTKLAMSAFADKQNLKVTKKAIKAYFLQLSFKYKIEPQNLVKILQKKNQLSAVIANIRYESAILSLINTAAIVDENGVVLDFS